MKNRQWIIYAVGALVICLVLSAAIYFIGKSSGNNVVQVGPTSTTSQQTGLGGAKPQMVADYFQGCPPSGDGGDPVLNTLKNRIDEANWQPATVASILALTWPPSIEQQSRAKWSPADRQAIAQYEGAPLQVEGYLLDAKKMSPESCNCHSVDNVDFHIWLVDDPSKDRTQSVVIESSPRVRSYHPAWTLANLRTIIKNKQRLRISGWLLMDPEHPDQIGKTRGTIWEIHPIMQIETQQNGKWMPLDNGTTAIHSGPAAAQTLPTIVPAGTATTPAVEVKGRQDNNVVKITNVFADGTKGSAEPDEHVEVTNTGDQQVDITDWVLKNGSDRDEYKWESAILQPHQVIDVYTNEVHQNTGGFTFESSRAIWPNSGGVAELYDSDKQLISRFAYGNQK